MQCSRITLKKGLKVSRLWVRNYLVVCYLRTGMFFLNWSFSFIFFFYHYVNSLMNISCKFDQNRLNTFQVMIDLMKIQ
jgi:hypothetical protein